WTAAFKAQPTTDLPAAADIQIYEGTSAAICNADVATLTRVPDADVIADRDGATATTTALMMDLLVGSHPDHAWKPATGYRIQFASTARVLPSQGGPAGTFPGGYKLCFKTSAAAM